MSWRALNIALVCELKKEAALLKGKGYALKVRSAARVKSSLTRRSLSLARAFRRGPELWPTNPRAQEGLRRFGLPDGVLGYAQVDKWLKDDTFWLKSGGEPLALGSGSACFDLDENVCLEALDKVD